MGLQGSAPDCSAALSKPGEPPALSTGRGQHSPSALWEEVGQDICPPRSLCLLGWGERAWVPWWEDLRNANRLQMEKMQGRKWTGECCEVQKKVGSTGVDRCTVGRCRH